MEELNLQEIEKKLRGEFEAGERLVFWYDAEGSFEEDLDRLNLGDAKILRLTENNAFRTKLFLEHEDTEHQYLVYAPFAKPDVRHNHLEDTMLYSKQFYADRLSLIAADIGLPDRFRASLQKKAKFFGIGQKNTKAATRRTNEFIQRAAEVDLPTASADMIDLIAMCVVSKARNITVDDLMYAVLSYGDIEQQEIISEFEKVDLDQNFWELCQGRFGYSEPKPTLLRFVLSLFAVHACRDFADEAPKQWKNFLQDSVRGKITNISVLLDNMMNSVIYQDAFNALSEKVESELGAKDVLSKMNPDKLLTCTTFKSVDELLIQWMIQRELAEDKGAALNGMMIPDICDMRCKMHFGTEFLPQYKALQAGYQILQVVGYTPEQELSQLIDAYTQKDYAVDTQYRKFIVAMDEMTDSTAFDELNGLIQNIYQNDYLEKIVYAWNNAFIKIAMHRVIPFQTDFYRDQVKKIKEKTVVIISDAFRYETAMELAKKFEEDPNCEVQMNAMMGTLPSYTAVGMAALLPHDMLSMTEDYTVLLDGKPCGLTTQREQILHGANPNSAVLRFENVRDDMNTKVLRDFTAGKEVIYVYHNRVDETGESSRNENSVFKACDESISEIFAVIKKFSKSANVYRFLITADHGFIYSRRKLTATDKLENEAEKGAFVDRRFIIDKEDLATDGVFSLPLSDALGSTDDRFIMLPKGMSVFKAGGGMNYVHGGSSPQELIIPALFIKTQKGLVETEDVKLNLISDIRKITNLKVKLDFYQEKPVSDTVKAVTYRIRFESDEGEIISNEILFEADSRDEKPGNRIFTLSFDIKRKAYSNEHKYFLKVINEKTGAETMSRQVIMDLPFTDDFGF